MHASFIGYAAVSGRVRPVRLTAGWLPWGLWRLQVRDGPCRRLLAGHLELFAVVRDLERIAGGEAVGGMPVGHLDAQTALLEGEAEGEAGQL